MNKKVRIFTSLFLGAFLVLGSLPVSAEEAAPAVPAVTAPEAAAPAAAVPAAPAAPAPLAAPPPPTPPQRLLVGGPVPDFETKALDGTVMSFLKDMKKGKPIIINFMQTACSACLTEMEALKVVADTAKGKYDFYTVAVDLQEEAAVKRYLEAYPQFKDVRFLLDKTLKVSRIFGFSSTPALALIDSEGNLTFKMLGFGADQKKELEEGLKKLK